MPGKVGEFNEDWKVASPGLTQVTGERRTGACDLNYRMCCVMAVNYAVPGLDAIQQYIHTCRAAAA